ncbi:DNA ligase [Pelagibacteraceae bacterium GOM-A2]|nr:DNA ligase [Pelagibacteraceae bacterium GOM-A2]
MTENEIKKIYQSKIRDFEKHNELYYDKSSPVISDRKFDEIKAEILNLEKKYAFLYSDKSPSKSVGFKPSKNFEKFQHKVQMLSLSNAFDKKDLINFEKKILNYLNKNIELEYSVEPKIDGISASLTYLNGKLTYGVSRGDGSQGELITDNLKTIKDIPEIIKKINVPKEIEIRGEVFIEKSDFEKIKDKFANPRNAASGTLRQKNPKETSKIPLKFIAYTFGFISEDNFEYQSEFLKQLKLWGFVTSQYNQVIQNINELIKFHEQFEKKRYHLKYDIDGLVYKVNNIKLQKRLGFTSNSPRWAIAHKFSADHAYSEILNIDIQIGRTGALTPVAKVRPVNIGGVVVSNATLHNEDEIIRKDIRVGDTVKIERAGDVIPHVLEVDLKKRKKKLSKFIFPLKCPSCGSNTEKEYNRTTKKFDAVRRCTNESFTCEKIAIEKIKHFISKDAINIDGLGKKVVEKFWDLNFIRSPEDIYNLDYKKISSLDGWGSQSVSNLKFSIENSREVTLEKFIFSLGIRHIGIENAKIIRDFVKNEKNFFNLVKKNKFQDLINIDGIGETQIKSLEQFFQNENNIKVMKNLIEILKFKNKEIKKKGKLKDKSFMFTGKLQNISRAEAKNLIEENSGNIVSSVTKKLDYLVIGEKPTNRKVEQAKNLGIKILSQKEWSNLLDKFN